MNAYCCLFFDPGLSNHKLMTWTYFVVMDFDGQTVRVTMFVIQMVVMKNLSTVSMLSLHKSVYDL